MLSVAYFLSTAWHTFSSAVNNAKTNCECDGMGWVWMIQQIRSLGPYACTLAQRPNAHESVPLDDNYTINGFDHVKM